MRGTEAAVKLALTPAGAAVDRLCVRHLGHSPVIWLFARSGRVPYNPPLLLVTIGRRTGLERTAVLPYFAAGAGVAVVGSRGGMPTDPYWAHNLRAHPEAHVVLRRREHRVRARIARGEEREQLWKEISLRAPVYVEYQDRAKAHRELPIFVLEREDGGALG